VFIQDRGKVFGPIKNTQLFNNLSLESHSSNSSPSIKEPISRGENSFVIAFKGFPTISSHEKEH
jgi:hypothetical protein